MFQVEPQSIRFSNGKLYRVQGEIAETMEFGESIVVRVAAGLMSMAQNVFALDYLGNLLWRMPQPRSFSPNSPYVALFRKGDFVDVMNWDGHMVTLHAKRGDIFEE